MKDYSMTGESHELPGAAVSQWRHRWLTLGVISLLLGLGVLGLTATQLGNDNGNRIPQVAVLPVSTQRIQPQQGYEVNRVFIGRVEAARRSAVGFELGGMLHQVWVDEGDEVSQGQRLARLDTARLESRRQESIAALEEARANLAFAQATFKRFEGVVSAGGVSRQGLDEAREAYRAAQAGVELARSRVATINVDLAKSELRVPFDGVVIRRWMDEGQVTAAGEPVFELMEEAKLEVRIGIAGQLVDSLQVGQIQTVLVRRQHIPARVKAVLPVRGAATRTVDIILTLEDRPPTIRPGDLATLTLTASVSEPGYWLPLDALGEGPRGLWTVYRLKPVGGKPSLPKDDSGATYEVVPHLVEILHEESDRIFARGALQANSLVVADGLHRIVPGQLVRLAQQSDVQVAQGDIGYVVH